VNELFLGGKGAEGAGGTGLLTGLAVGEVTDNKDPNGLARVRVRLPGHGAGTSYWARTAMPMAGSGRGTYFLPEIGDEVLVGAAGGDPSHLYVLGMLWNGKAKPPADNSDGKNDRRVIRSRSGHELMFDDGAKPTVELKLKDGKRLKLDSDGVLVEDEKGNRLTILSNSGEITIESKASLKLKSQSISIEAGATMEIKATGALTLKGAMVQIN